MSIGKQIKHYRTKLNWKQDTLADLSGVASGTISALEIRDSARSEFFPAIARAFGLTVEQLADESTDWPVKDLRRLNVVGAAKTSHPMPANEPSAEYGSWVHKATLRLSKIDPEFHAETLSYLDWQASRSKPKNGQTVHVAG